MTPALWSAPTASAPVDATLTLPGSRSLTARALVLAALSTERSVIRDPLRSPDTLLMVRALKALGVGVDDLHEYQDAHDTDVGGGWGNGWSVIPGVLAGPAHLDVADVGTAMRFLLPVAALAEGTVEIDGGAAARRQPLGPLIGALRKLGARVDDGETGHLPLTVQGTGGLDGGAVDVDSSVSSQFVSALLLSGPRFNQGVDVRHVGPPFDAAQHLPMTVAMLRRAGVQVDNSEPDRWRVAPGAVRGLNVEIDPDLTLAAPFLAAAVVTGGRVTVTGWPGRSSQPGDALPDLLTAMGAVCAEDDTGLTVTGTGTPVGIDADLGQATSLVPVIAAVATLAGEPSHLRGLGPARAQYPGWLERLASELGRIGADVEVTDDGLTVRPHWLHGDVITTHGDPSLALAGAVLGLVVHDLRIDGLDDAMGRRMPDFASRWERLAGSGN